MLTEFSEVQKIRGGLGDCRNARGDSSASEFMAVAAASICRRCMDAIIMTGNQQAKINRANPVYFCLRYITFVQCRLGAAPSAA